MATALRQVVSNPKFEYEKFDGYLQKYVTFMHNFETCLDMTIPVESRKLQLLIQHCGNRAAPMSLSERFGKTFLEFGRKLDISDRWNRKGTK